MTQRYISAINYADNKAVAILKKHSKKRPLGEIENKYGYTPPQPVLSCRTVNVDLSGTRTYRPRSTTDILQEQHKLIHDIYTKNRNIKSAPQKQKLHSNSERIQRINIEVQGRPLTSLSQVSKTETKKSSIKKSKRPKTTGYTKTIKPNITDSFILIRVDRDVLESAPSSKNLTNQVLKSTRSSKELTNQIHNLWLPENHDLNQGKFIRGQKKVESEADQFNAWLTFGGNQDEDDQGVVDAFTGINNYDKYYSIDGNVGSKVAATLTKGDKVRIGVNGVVHSHSPRVKKTSILDDSDMFGVDVDAFDDMILQNLDEMMDERKRKPDTTPLNWTDQVSKTDVKIVESKGKSVSSVAVNLCESHPVIFERLVKYDDRPRLARGNTDGFKIKHRSTKQDVNNPKYHQVKNIVIDSKSHTEEKHLDSMTLDDVLKKTIAQRNRYNLQTNNFQAEKFKIPNKHEQNGSVRVDTEEKNEKYTRSNSCKSRGSTTGEVIPSSSGNLLVPVPRSVPSTFTSTIDSNELMVTGPGAKHNSPTNEMPRRAKTPISRNSTSAKSRSRISSAASHKPSLIHGDPKYIKFSSHIKNPNDEIHSSSPTHKQSVRFVGDNDVGSDISSKFCELESVGDLTDRSNPSRTQTPPAPTSHGFSINIPTADMLSDRDSMLQSPCKKSEDDETMTTRQKRNIDLRDEQINQITTMLAGSVNTQA